MLAPTPDQNYSFELHYKYRPASLTTTSGTDTTWLSSNAPDALLYGTLVEAATFLKIQNNCSYLNFAHLFRNNYKM